MGSVSVYWISALLVLVVALVFARPNWQDLPMTRIIRRAPLIGGWGEVFAEIRDLSIWVIGLEFFSFASSASICYAGVPFANAAYTALNINRSASVGPLNYVSICLLTAFAIAQATKALCYQVTTCPPKEVVDPTAVGVHPHIGLRLGRQYVAGFGPIRRTLYSLAPLLLLPIFHQVRRRDNAYQSACINLLREEFGESLVLRNFHLQKQLNVGREKSLLCKFVLAVEAVYEVELLPVVVDVEKSYPGVTDALSAQIVLEAMYLDMGYRGTAALLRAFKDSAARSRRQSERVLVNGRPEVLVTYDGTRLGGTAVDVSKDGSGIGIQLHPNAIGRNRAPLQTGRNVYIDVKTVPRRRSHSSLVMARVKRPNWFVPAALGPCPSRFVGCRTKDLAQSVFVVNFLRDVPRA